MKKPRVRSSIRLAFLVTVPSLAFGLPLKAATAPIATTQAGKVRGATLNRIHVFKGIRYGASTEGRRFMAPLPPEPWHGVVDALDYGNESPQKDPERRIELLSSWRNPRLQSEDCLFLNIWTSGLRDGRKRPVMVWFHGGGFSNWSGSAHGSDGTRLATKGDVVVVTLNHRLNIFGYLYLARLINAPELADSGNVGSLDLILALQWVRNNIAEFGGDPDNVMIFGQSGGGRKVSCVMTMPDARGLFHRAAVQSGSDLHRQTPEAATAVAVKFMKAVGLETNQVETLRRLPVERLVEALNRLADDDMFLPGPVVDGRSLLRHPFDPGAPPASAAVPLLVGTVKDETTTLFGGPKKALFDLTWETVSQAVAPYTGTLNLGQLIASMRRLHPEAKPSDVFFTVSTWQRYRNSAITQAVSKWEQSKSVPGAAPAYLYELVWETRVDGGKWKSPHSLDVAFVFDNMALSESLCGRGPEQQRLADQMSDAWLRFARTGDPGWPAYNPQTRATMVFDVESRVINDFNREKRELLSRLPAR